MSDCAALSVVGRLRRRSEKRDANVAQTLLSVLCGAAARIPERPQASNGRARRDRRARHYYELRQTCGVGTGAGGAGAGVCGSDLRLRPRRFAFRMRATCGSRSACCGTLTSFLLTVYVSRID